MPAFDGGWLPMDDGSLELCLDHARLGGDAQLVAFTGTDLGSDGTGAYLNFRGTGQHLRINAQVGAAGSEERTVAAWVRTQTVGGVIISWGNRTEPGSAWVMRVDPANGALRVEVQNGFVVGSTPLTTGQWNHVAAVFDPSIASANVTGVRLYVNGVQQSITSSGSRTINTAANTPIWIGGESARPELFFTGQLRDVQWMPRALSAAAVAELARADLPRAHRWYLTRFPQVQPDWQRLTSGSGNTLLLHYATGIEEDQPMPNVVQLEQTGTGTLRLSARRDPLAAVNLIPEVSQDPAANWSVHPSLFQTVAHADGYHHWIMDTSAVPPPVFIRIAYSVAQ
ncbi:MAG: LamG domain-containing protein [Verrucomicrobia bacterium]|nr:LamG domain-containing protein [Verrucomicrobiota bacterium]